MNQKLVRPFMLAGACAVAVALAACDNSANRSNSSSTSTPAAERNASNNEAITLTGCLARGDGHNDYVLTKANQPVGTSGESTQAGSIPEKTRAAAERSYRLNGDNDQLDGLVGHRIRVSGTIADRGDLNASSDKNDSQPRGTSGEASKNQEISESDLAKVDVKSVESVADSCNGVNPPAKR